MKIEPCPVCGAEVGEFYDACGLFFYKCSKCSYRICRHDVEAHNRTSRIVLAAKEWARLLPTGPSGEYVASVCALVKAVNGGGSDETPTASPPD